MSKYIIVARPPVVENPLTEEEPMRVTTAESVEAAIAEGAPVITRPATIQQVEHEGGEVGFETLQKHIGGYIERAHFIRCDPHGLTIDFWGDEEGLIKRLTPTLVRPTDGWVLRGPLVVCMGTPEGESTGLKSVYFDDVWGMFSILGFVDVAQLPSRG